MKNEVQTDDMFKWATGYYHFGRISNNLLATSIGVELQLTSVIQWSSTLLLNMIHLFAMSTMEYVADWCKHNW